MKSNIKPSEEHRSRDDNSVIFIEVSRGGGRLQLNGKPSEPGVIGRMYFELRADLVPQASSNFLALIEGRGRGQDGVDYTYKGTQIYRCVRDSLFQGGDLLNEKGNCSRSSFNGELFPDENYILRHTGPGCLSMCNRGPDTNGSLFQVTMRENRDMDERYVVFGCIVNEESMDVLNKINNFGTIDGEPTEELIISDCGVAYPL
jgi:cyclophilin family peptidyl-prolyl cis-trans isomerase